MKNVKIEDNGGSAGRIAGYDIARGLAVWVMVVLNFRGVLSGSFVHPHWLDLLLAMLDRRAAVALVMISGAGVTLWAEAALDRAGRLALVRRGVFLMGAGLLLLRIWSGDILHVYGVLLLLGAFLARKSRVALACAGLFFGAGVLVRLSPLFDLVEEGTGHWASDGLLDLLFTGYFPLFPWAAFFVAGMGLGRLPVRDGRIRSYLWALGLGLMALAAWGQRLGLSDALSRIDLAWPTPLAVVSGLGSGVCAILAGCAVAGIAPGWWGRLLTAAGQTSLSLYVFHILVLIPLAFWAGSRGIANLVPVACAAVGFFLFYAGAARAWLARWGRGPLEAAMRRF